MSKTNNSPVLLHLHIPKTAGGTLNKIIYAQVASPDYPTDKDKIIFKGIYHLASLNSFGFFKEPDLKINPADIDIVKTQQLKAVIGHFSFGIHRYLPGASTYVTLVRNPVDRLISLYHHCNTRAHLKSGKILTLEQFLTDFKLPGLEFQQTQLLTDNDQTRRISGIEPPFGKCTIAMLETAKKNLLSHFSVVGVTDRFEEMVVLLKRKFGWPNPHIYWPIHIRTERSEELQYKKETIDQIRDMNRFDLALYDFIHQTMDDAIDRSGEDFERDMSIFQSQRNDFMKTIAQKKSKLVKRIETAQRRVKRDSRL